MNGDSEWLKDLEITFRVGARMEKTVDSLICYCFGYTASDIERDLLANKKSAIMARIMTEKKAGGCQCATRNPKGR